MPGARPFLVAVDSDGLFRLRLARQDGEDFAEVMIAGTTPVPVMLSGGSYRAAVEDMLSGARFAPQLLSFDDGEKPVLVVTHQLPASPPRARASSLDRRTSGMAAEAAPRRPPGGPPLAALPGVMAFVANARAAVPEERRFAIGLAEDRAPGRTGGWQQPQAVDVQVMMEGRRLTIRLDDRASGRRSKLRCVVAVQGLPAVRVPVPLFRGGLQLVVAVQSGQSGPDLRVTPGAVDHPVQGLVAALRLPAGEALPVVRWACGPDPWASLRDDHADPWATTVAALVLLRAGALAGGRQWLPEFARQCPHIADAHIAAAWAAIATEGQPVAGLEAQAIDSLRRAGNIGAANFVAANSLALDLLASLAATAETAKVRQQAATELQRVRERSRFRLYDTPYMIWENRREKLGALRPLPGHYRIIAQGQFGAEGFGVSVSA